MRKATNVDEFDRGVFRNSAFNNALERSKLNLTDPAPLPTSTDPTLLHEQNDPLPYVFVANDVFPWERTAWNRILRPILVTENAYLITGYQEYDVSVKMCLVFGVVDFACLELQCCFHRKKLSP